MSATLGIGDLARRTGCKVPTIRYYERIGLLPAAGRTDGNQRRYPEAVAGRLGFIVHARALGFSLDAVRALLDLSDQPGRSCEEIDAIAQGHLDAVESRIASLAALRDELRRMVAACRGGNVGDCRVVEVLGDHSLCRIDHDPRPATLHQAEYAVQGRFSAAPL